MKSLFLSAAALLGLTVAASAADLPRRSMAPMAAPIMSVPVFTWTGFYVGVQGGYAFGQENVRIYDTVTGLNYGRLDGSDLDGVVGGVHAGYNVQFGSIVVGVEGDIEATGIESKRVETYTAGGVVFTDSYKATLDYQASLRARIGFAFDRALVYATGGVAYGDFGARFSSTAAVGGVSVTNSIKFSDDAFGYTLGAGVEYAVTNNLTVRAEYRYTSYDLGRFDDRTVGLGASSEPDFHTVRVGASYKF
ncbi:outer membrane protein [Salinarimonas soli]|uniref:Porin family protein n=1 Tax=Salinarimonas soli TaxID=1638099 RepID=A0A5B2V830_9HYPH|nr:outer membrane protein [Salinarimonas soli]KAA2234357.1 porin family protein [Salinarimonas soli]